MTIDLEGKRLRFFHEREDNAANEGYPLHADVSEEARCRLVREISGLAYQVSDGFIYTIWGELTRVLGSDAEFVPGDPQTHLSAMPLKKFLAFLEIAGGADLLPSAQDGGHQPSSKRSSG